MKIIHILRVSMNRIFYRLANMVENIETVIFKRNKCIPKSNYMSCLLYSIKTINCYCSSSSMRWVRSSSTHLTRYSELGLLWLCLLRATPSRRGELREWRGRLTSSRTSRSIEENISVTMASGVNRDAFNASPEISWKILTNDI